VLVKTLSVLHRVVVRQVVRDRAHRTTIDSIVCKEIKAILQNMGDEEIPRGVDYIGKLYLNWSVFSLSIRR
jgi:hypothetical protein